MSTDTLFDVPESLSPRLAWMKRKRVITYRCPSDGLWLADFYDIMDDFIHQPASYFQQETSRNGDHYIGTGQTEDDAITKLCQRYRVKLWNEEQP